MGPAFGALLGVLVFCHLASIAAAADIFYDGEGHVRSRTCRFHVIGDIAPGDGDLFRRKMLRAIDEGCLPVKVVLYSAGGDLHAAIDIGRQLSALNMHTEAPDVWMSEGEPPERRFNKTRYCHFRGKAFSYNPATEQGDRNCVCASACFFIWVAGTKRFGNVVIIHRPYFDPKVYSNLPVGDAQKHFAELTRAAQQYLASLEIPEALITRMLSISSREGSFLSDREIKQLRSRRFFEELVIARCGRTEREVNGVANEAAKRAEEAL